jgi:hypothetical protein
MYVKGANERRKYGTKRVTPRSSETECDCGNENFLKYNFPQSAANLSEWPLPAEARRNIIAISASCADGAVNKAAALASRPLSRHTINPSRNAKQRLEISAKIIDISPSRRANLGALARMQPLHRRPTHAST